MNADERGRRDLSAGHGFLLYVLVLGGMLVGGALLQQLHMRLGLILSEVLIIATPALLVRQAFRAPQGWPTLRSTNLPAPWLLWVALTAALLGLAANLVSALIVELVPSFQPLAEQYEAMVKQMLFPGGEVALLGVVAVTIAAPLCEEFLFRGVLLPAQRASTAPVAAIVVTNGVLFSLLHVNPFGFVALAAVGTFFAHLTLLTRSLWPAIIGHAVLNTVNGVLIPVLVRDTAAETAEPSLTELLAGCAIIVPVVAAAWTWGAKRLGKPPRRRPPKE